MNHTEYRRGLALGAACGVIFSAGGGEGLTEGMSAIAFGSHAMRATDKLLRVGNLKDLIPSGETPEFLSARDGRNPIATLQEVWAERVAAGDDASLEKVGADLAFLKGFANALTEFGLLPTIEEQRSTDAGGREFSTALLLCAVQSEVRR